LHVSLSACRLWLQHLPLACVSVYVSVPASVSQSARSVLSVSVCLAATLPVFHLPLCLLLLLSLSQPTHSPPLTCPPPHSPPPLYIFGDLTNNDARYVGAHASRQRARLGHSMKSNNIDGTQQRGAAKPCPAGQIRAHAWVFGFRWCCVRCLHLYAPAPAACHLPPVALQPATCCLSWLLLLLLPKLKFL